MGGGEGRVDLENEWWIRFYSSAFPFLSLSPFPLLSSFLSFLRPARWHMSVCVHGTIYLCAFVLEQVRRRLKSRQPGGRRRSKGFRLVPPTRTASVVAVHPRAEAGQIKRARADNTRHWEHRDTRARKAERWCRIGKGGCARQCTPRRPYRGKATAWKTTPRQRPRPGLDGKAGRLLGKKERTRLSPVLFFDAVHCGPRTGIWKAPEGWAKYAKLVNATEVNTREESEAGNKEADMRFKGNLFDVGVFTAK